MNILKFIKSACLIAAVALVISLLVPNTAHADMVVGPFSMGTSCPGGQGTATRYNGRYVYCAFSEQVFSAVYANSYCPIGVAGAVTVRSGRGSWCLVYRPGFY